MRRFNCIALSFILGVQALSFSHGLAAETSWRTIRTRDEFSQGKLKDLSLDSTGTLELGMAFHAISARAPRVWSIASGGDGRLFFSTGSPGVIWIHENGESRTLMSDPASMGHLLVADGEGGVLAASINRGHLFRIDREGRISQLARLQAAAVWALLGDGDGNLFAATGKQAGVYRISRDGTVVRWLESDEFNLVSLARGSAGSLFAGSGERGNIYKLQGPDSSEVWHHFGKGSEVRALSARDEILYAGVNVRAGMAAGAASSGSASGSEEEFSESLESPEEDDGSGTGKSSIKLSGTLHAIDSRRRAEEICHFEGEMILSIAQETAGTLLVGTGPGGRLYRVEPNQGEVTLIRRGRQSHVLCLATEGGELAAAGTADPGAILISLGRSRRGTWTSPVYDAGTPARYGAIRGHASGKIRISSRTGSTSSPDGQGWTEWSYSGSSSDPAARFLQLRVELEASTPAPRIEDLTVFYRLPNQRPTMDLFEVNFALPVQDSTSGSNGDGGSTGSADSLKSGESGDSGDSESTKDTKHSGKVHLHWTQEDRDNDELVARLFYRSTVLRGRGPWLPMNGGEELKTDQFDWDTRSVPDGRYEVRIEVSDELSNPEGEELSVETISEPIEVDNDRPWIDGLSVQDGALHGMARDESSHVAELHYSVDGGRWIALDSQDGLLDRPEESFRLTLPALDGGIHVIAIRARDARGNIGVAHHTLGETEPGQ